MSDVPVVRDDLIELFVVRAMRTFDPSVQLGGTRREHEQGQAPLLAGAFKLGSEFTAAIDLQGGNRKGHAVNQRIEEVRGGQRSGPLVHFHNIPARDHVAGREVFQHHSACWPHFFGVELHQISRPPNRPKTGLSSSPGTTAHLAPPSGYCGRRGFDQHASSLQIAENATHHRSGKAKSFAAKQQDQLVLPPAGILAPQGQDRCRLRRRPCRLPPPLGAMRVILQRGEVMRVVAAPPAIEGLPTDAEMAASERSVATVSEIVGHPLHAELAGPAQLVPQARELSRLGHPSPSNLYDDTLPSVTNHSEREQSIGLAVAMPPGYS